MLKRALPPMLMAFFAVYMLSGAVQAAFFSSLPRADSIPLHLQALLREGLQRAAYAPVNLLLAGAATYGVWRYEAAHPVEEAPADSDKE